jgi:hypothetical protein
MTTEKKPAACRVSNDDDDGDVRDSWLQTRQVLTSYDDESFAKIIRRQSQERNQRYTPEAIKLQLHQAERERLARAKPPTGVQCSASISATLSDPSATPPVTVKLLLSPRDIEVLSVVWESLHDLLCDMQDDTVPCARCRALIHVDDLQNSMLGHGVSRCVPIGKISDIAYGVMWDVGSVQLIFEDGLIRCEWRSTVTWLPISTKEQAHLFATVGFQFIDAAIEMQMSDRDRTDGYSVCLRAQEAKKGLIAHLLQKTDWPAWKSECSALYHECAKEILESKGVHVIDAHTLHIPDLRILSPSARYALTRLADLFYPDDYVEADAVAVADDKTESK